MYLIKNGVPFDVAFALPADERSAWVVIIGGFNGLDYDWEQRCWKQT